MQKKNLEANICLCQLKRLVKAKRNVRNNQKYWKHPRNEGANEDAKKDSMAPFRSTTDSQATFAAPTNILKD